MTQLTNKSAPFSKFTNNIDHANLSQINKFKFGKNLKSLNFAWLPYFFFKIYFVKKISKKIDFLYSAKFFAFYSIKKSKIIQSIKKNTLSVNNHEKKRKIRMKFRVELKRNLY